MLNITFAPNDLVFYMKVSKQFCLMAASGKTEALLQHALIMLMKYTESIWEIKCY